MVLGRLWNASRWLQDPYGFLDAATARHGPTFRLALPTRGRALVTGDPELIREAVQCPDLEGGKGISALREVFGGDSLITVHGDGHRWRRRLLAPLFHDDHAASYDRLTVETTREVVSELRPGEPFSAYRVLRAVSLRVIVRVVFGDLPAAEARQAAALVDAFLGSFSSPLVLFLRALHLDFGGRGPWGRASRNRARLQRFIRTRIHTSTGAGVVARLGGGSEYSDDQLVAEVLALLLFGHDTAAATMAWALAHLCQHPDDLMSRIRREADGTAPGAEHPLLEAVLLESMRLCPVVVHLTRVTRRDLTLGGHELRVGDRVLPSAYVAQRNAEIFPRPDHFEPERFLNWQPPPYAYFPFGLGRRTCVGKPFALRQMMLVLSTLVATLDLTLAPGYRCRSVRRLVLIVPSSGTLLVARPKT